MKIYNEELQRLQAAMMEETRLEAKLAELMCQQKELVKKTNELHWSMRQEQEDVERLNSRNLTALYYRVTGKMGEKLSKEEQEAYAAAVKYDSANSELQAVNEKIEEYRKQLSDLRGCGRKYQALLEEKKEEIKKTVTPDAVRIIEIEEKISFQKTRQKEIDEAVSAGRRAQNITIEIINSLDEAKSWSTVDIIGGGILSDMIKYDAIGNAKRMTDQLQLALRNFRAELADVTEEMHGDIYTEISSTLCFADYFFDNLFTDWLVRNRINESRNKAEQTCEQIQKVLQNLHQIKEQNICIQRQLEKELEETVAVSEAV